MYVQVNMCTYGYVYCIGNYVHTYTRVNFWM